MRKESLKLRTERRTGLWRNRSIGQFYNAFFGGVDRKYEDDILRYGATSSVISAWIG